VILTPHMAGITDDSMMRMGIGAAEGLDPHAFRRRPEEPLQSSKSKSATACCSPLVTD